MSQCCFWTVWDVPMSRALYHVVCPIPCVHPVPLYHWEGMGPNGMSRNVPCGVPSPMCPSRPIVPLGGDGTEWDVLHHVPCSVPNPMCPSRPVVPLGGNGTSWDVPQCTMQCTQSHVSILSCCTIGREWEWVGCLTTSHAKQEWDRMSK